jgi:molecular chaperone GrpE
MTKKSPGTHANKKTEHDTVKKGSSRITAPVNENESAEAEKIDIPSDEELDTEPQNEFAAEKTAGEEAAEKVTLLEEKVKEWQDKYLRLSAEFDNYRKRTLKEKAELIKTANEDLLVDILVVVDDFERGIDTIDKSQDLDALRDGIHLIYNKFSDFLKQKGVKEIEAKDKEFDLEFHEAITKIPASSEELKGKVMDVIAKGYLLNDKVIRYAKVVVGE